MLHGAGVPPATSQPTCYCSLQSKSQSQLQGPIMTCLLFQLLPVPMPTMLLLTHSALASVLLPGPPAEPACTTQVLLLCLRHSLPRTTMSHPSTLYSPSLLYYFLSHGSPSNLLCIVLTTYSCISTLNP